MTDKKKPAPPPVPEPNRAKMVYSTAHGDLRKKPGLAAALAGIQLQPATDMAEGAPAPEPPRLRTLKITRDTKARRGKMMTRIAGLGAEPAQLEELLAQLRTRCGAGGTVEGPDLLLQGDHVQTLPAHLKAINAARD